MFVLLSVIGLVNSSSVCSPARCPSLWQGDDYCDLGCMSLACNFDSLPGEVWVEASDCLNNCTATGCQLEELRNQYCNEGCNSPECGWDLGSCGVCAAGCMEKMVGNGVCDSACNILACEFDSGDCVIPT